MTAARHYNPHPVLSTLRQAGGGLFPQIDDRPLPTVKAASELGLKLPRRPSGLSAKERAAWDTLENVEVIQERLDRAYKRLTLLLGRVGGALCDDLRRYNKVALDLFGVQEEAVRALRDANVAGAPLQAPFPNLFVGFGAQAGDGIGQINCEAGQVVGPASQEGGDGVRISERNPSQCPEGSFQQLQGLGLAAMAVIGITLVVTAGGVLAVREIANSWEGVEQARERTRQGKLEAEFLERRSKQLQGLVEGCVAQGGDPEACLRQAGDAVPKSLKSLRKERGRSVFFWIGVGSVTLAAGAAGYAWWRHRQTSSGGEASGELEGDPLFSEDLQPRLIGG